MNIWIAIGGITQRITDLPVPVGKEAVPEAVEDTENKPWKSCEPQCDQVQFSQTAEQPAKQIKKDKRNVKNEKEIVSEAIKLMVVH